MANSPYTAPKTKFKSEGVTQEAKDAWFRFYGINQRMKRWHRKGQPEKVAVNMKKWEALNRQAWGYGWEVPDSFSPDARSKFMHRRSEQ